MSEFAAILTAPPVAFERIVKRCRHGGRTEFHSLTPMELDLYRLRTLPRLRLAGRTVRDRLTALAIKRRLNKSYGVVHTDRVYYYDISSSYPESMLR